MQTAQQHTPVQMTTDAIMMAIPTYLPTYPPTYLPTYLAVQMSTDAMANFYHLTTEIFFYMIKI